MPSYIISNPLSGLSSGLCCGDKNDYCKDSTRFLNKLATKLLDMAKAIDTRIEKIKEECVRPQQGSRGFIIAEIEVPKMNLGVKYEYIEYIKRYGPPINGIFEEDKLTLLRQELGLSSNI